MSETPTFDPCPTCGRDVRDIEVNREFDWMADLTRVARPAEMTLTPCGHPIYEYRHNLVTDHVSYRSAPDVEWTVSS
jgi:hypothetical protein